MTVILVNAEAGRAPLPAGVVHCSVSSPPYYSLRAYEGDQARDWPEISYSPMPGLPKMTIPAMHCALGHESTPEAFIGHLVACYHEVKRVLRDDGMCWVVIGDSYMANQSSDKRTSNERASSSTLGPKRDGLSGHNAAHKAVSFEPIHRRSILQQGQLMLIPHRLALALQADGWTVRNDCVWHKVAPMPESVQGTRWQRCRVKVKAQDNDTGVGKWQNRKAFGVGPGSNSYSPQYLAQWTDCPGCPRCESTGGYVLRRGSWRHTRAHETILHLSKGMGYWSDGEAVREGLTQSSIDRINQPTFDQQTGGDKDYRSGVNANRSMRKTLENFADNPSGRNPRSVLTPKPESYSGKHYAVFSTSLIRPLIKSSCPVRCCPACGAGWAPQIEKGEAQARPDNPNPALPYTAGSGHTNGTGATTLHKTVSTNILGYYPTCACHAGNPDPPHAPGLVLDPFFGSGTTGLVARELGVDCIGLDLSYDYLYNQARARLELDAWDAWHQGRDGAEAASLAGLPLFEGVE